MTTFKKTSVHEKCPWTVRGRGEGISSLYQITISHFRVEGGRGEAADVCALDYQAKVTAKPNMTVSQSLVSYLQT